MIHIILFIFGVFLICINLNADKKEEDSFLTAFKNKEKNTSDVDFELMGIRKDLAESILDLQHEIDELRQELVQIKGIGQEKTIKLPEKSYDIINDNTEDVISNINYNNMQHNISDDGQKQDKVPQIKKMIQQGKSDDEICNALNVGKGEVLLIRGLYK